MRTPRPAGDAILAALGTAARQTHVPVHDVVLLGQCEQTAIDFTASVIHGTHEAFLEAVDWDHLADALHENLVAARTDDAVQLPRVRA